MANIGKSITFKGELTGDEDLEIDGRVEGGIQLPKNQLTIGANGDVKAEINAKSVVVIGHLVGNINATERVAVQAAGVVEGDIRAPSLLIQEGAVVNGAIEMSKVGASTEAGQARTAGAGGSAPVSKAEKVRETG